MLLALDGPVLTVDIIIGTNHLQLFAMNLYVLLKRYQKKIKITSFCEVDERI